MVDHMYILLTGQKRKKQQQIRRKKIYNNCFQYTVTVTLNHEEIKYKTQRITKIKSFIDKYKWEEIYHPSEKDDWKKFEKNNPTLARNALYTKNEKIYPA